ncbi:MAG: MBL fold metallo-hydrolase [Clostridia bacterium]|nr:MBL fold metallo-hydrolase [Clostridia bacterium]
MKIEYLGHSCFALTNAQGVKIVTDPYTGVGYELSKNLHADILTVSHDHFDHNHTAAVGAVKAVCAAPIRQTVMGVEIEGVSTYHDDKQGALRGKNVAFIIKTDGLRVCHMGDLGEPYTEALAEKIGKVDVLLIPVGGTYTIDAAQAKVFVEKLAPRFAIPMHYRPQDGTIDITDAKPFLNGYTHVIYPTKKNETTVNINDLNEEKTQIIYMERA